jgi:hypothetical protein
MFFCSVSASILYDGVKRRADRHLNAASGAESLCVSGTLSEWTPTHALFNGGKTDFSLS